MLNTDRIFEYIDENWNKAKNDRSTFFNRLNSYKYICLFGAGGMGVDLAHYLTGIGIKIDFFCDNNEKLFNKEICLGIRCISIQELFAYKYQVLILISASCYNEIDKQLDEYNFERIVMPTSIGLKCKVFLNSINADQLKGFVTSLFNILYDEKSMVIASALIRKWFLPISEFHKYEYNEIKSDNQYFPYDLIKLTSDEVFIDAGAYDGDTIRDIIQITDSKFKQIIAYELDKNCFNKLYNYVQGLTNNIKSQIKLYNIGLYDKNQRVQYSENSTSSAISINVGQSGNVVRLSDHLANQKVTFIKMDIEGAETKALHGAEYLIRKDRPKLAICVYHEPCHLWEIPMYLKSIVPEYKIYIRHHSDFNVETVCYAIL